MPTRPKSTRKTNTGLRHVYYHPGRGKFYVRLTKDGKLHHAGQYFDDKVEAGKAAVRLRKSLGIPENPTPFAR